MVQVLSLDVIRRITEQLSNAPNHPIKIVQQQTLDTEPIKHKVESQSAKQHLTSQTATTNGTDANQSQHTTSDQNGGPELTPNSCNSSTQPELETVICAIPMSLLTCS